MPTLYNQTKRALSFELGAKTFACDAWGSVDVPGKLVEVAMAYGLPLGTVPVAPETRAKYQVQAEQEATRDEQLSALREQIADAQASERAAKEKLDETHEELSKMNTKVQESLARNAELERFLESALDDKKAAEDLLADTAKQATIAEERAIKSEAVNQKRSK